MQANVIVQSIVFVAKLHNPAHTRTLGLISDSEADRLNAV